MAQQIDVDCLKAMFEGVDDEYKQILVRDNKDLFTECITEINKTITSVDALVPPVDQTMNAFRLCKWSKLRVVLIGQDPYPTPGHAIGLAFATTRGAPIPRALNNIYRALIASEYMTSAPSHGDISSWADQGVLMLNAALSTTKNTIGKHLSIWKPYTKKILTDIATKFAAAKRPLVFIMWGNFAAEYKSILDRVNYNTINNGADTIHRYLTWGHPSPTSTNNNGDPATTRKHFANCDNFKQCNIILKEFGLDTIEWGKLDHSGPSNVIEEIPAAITPTTPLTLTVTDDMIKSLQQMLNP